jgi:hypothetical protein
MTVVFFPTTFEHPRAETFREEHKANNQSLGWFLEWETDTHWLSAQVYTHLPVGSQDNSNNWGIGT